MNLTPKQTNAIHDRESYRTPPHVMRYVCERWEPPELDVAAASGNKQAARYFTAADDALTCSWESRGLVWCNPPYTRPGPWVDKAVEERTRARLIVMLLPAAVDTKWWRVLHRRASEVIHIWPRVCFLDPDTLKPYGRPPGGVALVVFDRHSLAMSCRYSHVELRA